MELLIIFMTIIIWIITKGQEDDTLSKPITKPQYTIRIDEPLDLIPPPYKMPINSKWKSYEEYRISDECQKLNSSILERDNYECKVCGSLFLLHVHRLNYNHPFKERKKDLITLCKKCHDITHAYHGLDAESYPPIKHKDK